MTCPFCQAEVPAASGFCPQCGASTTARAQTVSSGAAAAAPAIQPAAAAAGGLSPNAAAAIAYVTIIPAIIFLVIEPYNHIKLVRFHAVQCIGLAIAAFVISMVLLVIPVIGWILQPLVAIAFLIVWIMCILKASKGEFFKLPFIGDFAEKQANS